MPDLSRFTSVLLGSAVHIGMAAALMLIWFWINLTVPQVFLRHAVGGFLLASLDAVDLGLLGTPLPLISTILCAGIAAHLMFDHGAKAGHPERRVVLRLLTLGAAGRDGDSLSWSARSRWLTALSSAVDHCVFWLIMPRARERHAPMSGPDLANVLPARTPLV